MKCLRKSIEKKVFREYLSSHRQICWPVSGNVHFNEQPSSCNTDTHLPRNLHAFTIISHPRRGDPCSLMKPGTYSTSKLQWAKNTSRSGCDGTYTEAASPCPAITERRNNRTRQRYHPRTPHTSTSIDYRQDKYYMQMKLTHAKFSEAFLSLPWMLSQYPD